MGLSTGFFAIIATDTEGFVDQKYIGCFANTLAYKKLDNAARFRCGFHPDLFDDAFLKLVLEFLAQIRSLIEQLPEGVTIELDDVGRDRRLHRRRTRRVARRNVWAQSDRGLARNPHPPRL